MIVAHTVYGQDDTHNIVVRANKTQNVMELDCTFEQYQTAIQRYKNGAMIQDAFHFLNSTQREFLMTGMSAEEQSSFFHQEF